MPDALSRIEVTVSTLARPVSETLLAARTAIRVTPALQAIFAQARAENWTAGRLADRLSVTLPEYLIDPQDLWDTCLYLADEFVQLGTHTLLISAQTGKALARFTDADIYLPPPVSRESGRLAQPLPRLRPDLEGLIVQWQFDRAQDQRTVETLAQRLPTTELLAQEGDPRLLRATLDGRKRIVETLSQDLPNLLQNLRGTSGELLKLCKFCTPEEAWPAYLPCAPRTAMARVVVPIVDPLAFNMQQDPLTAFRGQVGSQWARELASAIAGLAAAHRPPIEASVLGALPNGFWIAEPNTAMALRGKRVLPVPGATTTLLHDWLNEPAALLSVTPDSYKYGSREFLGRWEVAASFEYTLYLNPDAFSTYKLSDVPESGIAVEVVR